MTEKIEENCDGCDSAFYELLKLAWKETQMSDEIVPHKIFTRRPFRQQSSDQHHNSQTTTISKRI